MRRTGNGKSGSGRTGGAAASSPAAAASAPAPAAPAPFVLPGVVVEPGTRAPVVLPLGEMYDGSPVELRAHVFHGARPGPRLFVSSCLHGDELLGMISVRRVMHAIDAKELAGTLVAAPMVNHLGLLRGTREFPDGRDLNRCFPGSKSGPLASRFARSLLREVVSRCTHGIDLHTAALHRDNLPQIRGDLSDPETMRLAHAFGAPVIVHAKLRDGSLREAATARGVPTLLFEAGEALRHDDAIAQAGADGVLRVMHALGMLPSKSVPVPPPGAPPLVARSTSWVRAPRSGYFIPACDLGHRVRAGAPLGRLELRDQTGGFSARMDVPAPESGLVIGIARNPLVHVGDPLVHVARTSLREESA